MFNDLYANVFDTNIPNIQLLNQLPPYENLGEFEKRLREKNKLTFDHIFEETLGNFVFRQYLKKEAFVDHAAFLSDVYTYKTLTTESARKQAASRIYSHFLSPMAINHKDGGSIFSDSYTSQDAFQVQNALYINGGYLLKEIEKKIKLDISDSNLFEGLEKMIKTGLKKQFTDFLKSPYYKYLISCKSLELKHVNVNAFEILDAIGQGAFGSVHICLKSDSGTFYAMKAISKKNLTEKGAAETIMAERDFLATVNSKFVLSLNYAVMDNSNIYFILDLMTGGEIKSLLKHTHFDEKTTQFYIAQIMLGLSHIHEQQIIHRDMKLENILLDEKGNCKVSDLGLAVRVKKVRGYAGTPGYIAPEVIMGLYYDRRIDLFAFGVIAYRMLLGKKPFASGNKKNPYEADSMTINRKPMYPEDKISANALNLLQGFLMKDRNKRLTDFDEIKNHPFFSDFDFGMLEAFCIPPPIKIENTLHKTKDPKLKNNLKIKTHLHDDDFNASKDINDRLVTFRYKSKISIQQEVVNIFQYYVNEISFQQLVNAQISSDDLEEQLAATTEQNEQRLCCLIC